MEFILIILFAVSVSYIITDNNLEIPYTARKLLKAKLNSLTLLNNFKMTLLKSENYIEDGIVKDSEIQVEYTVSEVIIKVINCGICLSFWIGLFTALIVGTGLVSIPLAFVSSAVYKRFIIER